MKLKTKHRLCTSLLLFGIIIAVFGIRIKWMAALGVVLALGAVGLDALLYRCPFCRGSLEKRGPMPRYCPFCGQDLSDK